MAAQDREGVPVSDHDPLAEVKLALVDEVGPLHVLLHHPVHLLAGDAIANVVEQSVDAVNAQDIAPARFARGLYDPDVAVSAERTLRVHLTQLFEQRLGTLPQARVILARKLARMGNVEEGRVVFLLTQQPLARSDPFQPPLLDPPIRRIVERSLPFELRCLIPLRAKPTLHPPCQPPRCTLSFRDGGQSFSLVAGRCGACFAQQQRPLERREAQVMAFVVVDVDDLAAAHVGLKDQERQLHQDAVVGCADVATLTVLHARTVAHEELQDDLSGAHLEVVNEVGKLIRVSEVVGAREKLVHVDVLEPLQVAQVACQPDLGRQVAVSSKVVDELVLVQRLEGNVGGFDRPLEVKYHRLLLAVLLPPPRQQRPPHALVRRCCATDVEKLVRLACPILFAQPGLLLRLAGEAILIASCAFADGLLNLAAFGRCSAIAVLAVLAADQAAVGRRRVCALRLLCARTLGGLYCSLAQFLADLLLLAALFLSLALLLCAPFCQLHQHLLRPLEKLLVACLRFFRLGLSGRELLSVVFVLVLRGLGIAHVRCPRSRLLVRGVRGAAGSLKDTGGNIVDAHFCLEFFARLLLGCELAFSLLLGSARLFLHSFEHLDVLFSVLRLGPLRLVDARLHLHLLFGDLELLHVRRHAIGCGQDRACLLALATLLAPARSGLAAL